MYGQDESLEVPDQYAEPEAGDQAPVVEDSINDRQDSYEAHQLDGAVISDVYANDDSDLAIQPTGCSNQLTLSFRGQVYVFDDVTDSKVQSVFLLLGASEVSSTTQNADLGYSNSNHRGPTETSMRCSQPHRVASLMRFRQKRKERCFDKKIRYDVRQEVALRMERKKGQFSSSKKAKVSGSSNSAEESGQDDKPSENLCSHCGTSSKSTPMMRRGPDGPRTLCNACGLFWASKGYMRDLSKRIIHDNTLKPNEQANSPAM
ncbi:GATA transcription factor 25-like [Impatiens glandulifera]|uniref:GATA transcription factor 25-like n=1 Tax=Impatiens glandulifera TaxID=253017 RepID=UPI001FB1240C|nr:GATA transcription factor 25-like [Impatiens glandulifera]